MRLPRRAGALARASHPAPVVAVTALGTALAVAAGRSAAGSALVAGTLLAGQLSIGWSNDALDWQRDVAAGRTDKPVARGDLSPVLVRRAALTALAVCVPLSLANGLLAGSAHLVLVGGGWAYNLGLKRTAWSWVPYGVSFGLLPGFVSLGLPGRPWPAWWAVLAGALLGVAAHLANALPDLADDLATGVRGLPHRLGRRASAWLAALILAGAGTAVVLGPPGPPGVLGWTGLGVVAALAVLGVVIPAPPRSRRPFHALLALAALTVGLFLAQGAALAPGAGPRRGGPEAGTWSPVGSPTGRTWWAGAGDQVGTL